MNFQHLRHFIAVAEELHFGRAAERLGMAQPPLSQSIRRLEDSLGCALFIRTRRRVELTPAGVTLLEHGREIVDQVQYAQSALRRANEAGMTKVTIGFTPNALSDVVPAMMRELRRLAPGVDIELHEALSTMDAAASPHLRRIDDAGFSTFDEEQFAFDLDVIIRGLEARLATP